MLGDLFGNADEDEAEFTQQQQKSTFYKTKPAHCAGDLDLPPMPRQHSNFVGLLNQQNFRGITRIFRGATCYLNSLFQALYMTPQFRQAIFDLPLCEGSLEKQTQFGKNKRAYKMLFEIQRMLVMLQEADTRSWSTTDLTKSFGWQNNEGAEQQDIHELNRVLMDAIEQSLAGTPYESLVRELYFGQQNTVITCMECGQARRRSEPFMDLMLDVKGHKGVVQSISSLFAKQTFDGDNQLMCESDFCMKKTDSQRGLCIGRLPPVLTLSLNRIELDYNTWQRKKINDRFEFPLELDLTSFLDEEAFQSTKADDARYELKAIVVHRGGPYGGHYYAYIKDDLGQGNWDLEIPQVFAAKPLEKTVEPAKTPDEPEKKPEQTNKKKKNKQQKQPPQPKKISVELDYDLCDFPIAYSKQSLVQKWFEFNDSTVRPVMPGALQNTFGGNSDNAYMLIYRQVSLSYDCSSEIPDYWRAEIEKISTKFKAERDHFESLKNQLDIIVQDHQSIFKFSDGNFVQYIQDSQFEEQGMKFRLKFTDKVGDLVEKVQKELGLQGNFDMIEVQRLQNSYCQLLNPLSSFDKNALIKDTKVTHLSCWMLIVNDEELCNKIKNFTLEDALPVHIRVKYQENDVVLSEYSNLTVQALLDNISKIFSLDVKKICVKLIEETRITRIDTNLQNKENSERLNTLKDVKICHNSALLVEEKDPNEISHEKSVVGGQAYVQEVIDLDDTADFRTVIVNTQSDKQDFKRFQFNLNWSLKELTLFLQAQLELPDGQYRLRNHLNDKLFMQEEMDAKLRTYETFREGGVRLQIEFGRPTTMAEIAVTVFVLGADQDKRQFYFNATATLEECKAELCSAFELKESHTLYKVDAFEIPTQALRRVKQTLVKCQISSGDLLALKSDQQLLQEEKLKLSLHLTKTGLSEDSTYLQDVEVSRDYTLNELKEILCDQLEAPSVDHLRLREKSSNGFFGRIFREGQKTLKQVGVKDRSSLVLQVLQAPEILVDPNTFVLLLSERDSLHRTYANTREVRFTGKTLDQLFSFVQSQTGTEVDFKVVKHIPHAFEWKLLDPSEEVTEKKKNKVHKFLLRDIQDLKMHPILLRDGDHIAYSLASDQPDDLQTDSDLVLQQAFQIRKEEERRQKEADQASSNKKRGGDNASVKINLADDEGEFQ